MKYESLKDLEVTASTCTKCELSEQRTNVVFGRGDPDADLMFVGEGPGAEEDKQGLPFVGRSGKLLEEYVKQELGFDSDNGIYIANVVKCRPPDNRNPKPEEIAACRPYLDEQIRLINPEVIVTLGNFATQLLLDTEEGITRMRGQVYKKGILKIVPTFHPAAILRDQNKASQLRSDLVLAGRTLIQ